MKLEGTNNDWWQHIMHLLCSSKLWLSQPEHRLSQCCVCSTFFVIDWDHSNYFLMSLICRRRIKQRIGLATDLTYSQIFLNSSYGFVHFSYVDTWMFQRCKLFFLGWKRIVQLISVAWETDEKLSSLWWDRRNYWKNEKIETEAIAIISLVDFLSVCLLDLFCFVFVKGLFLAEHKHLCLNKM